MAIVVGAAFLLTAVFAAYAYLQKAEADRQRAYAQARATEAELESAEAKRQQGLADSARVNALNKQAEAVKQTASATSGRLATATLLNKLTPFGKNIHAARL